MQTRNRKTTIDINCDMGEGFGNWTIFDDIDTRMMPLVSSINLAAGFHAGDPTIIRRRIQMAREHGVGIGVHPGFRDLVGFGRRHIDATTGELVNDVIYQLGAVREFARLDGVQLQHLKLHGALAMHAVRDENFSTELIAALQATDPALPILVMPGSALHHAADQAAQPSVREFYADRHYQDDGQIVFTRDVGVLDADDVANKVLRACDEGVVETVTGNLIPVEFETVCIHSDTRGAHELMTRARDAIESTGVKIRSFNQSN